MLFKVLFMNYSTLWFRAQFINFLLVVLVFILGVLSSLPANRESDAAGILLLIAAVFLAFSFIGGIPLMLCYFYLEQIAEKLQAPSNWILRYLAMPICTFLYAALFMILIFQQWEETLNDPAMYLFCLPGTVSILIALAYAHYQERRVADAE